MKISYNPKSSQTAITIETAANDDIIFDLYASKLWAKGVRIGADWADISSKPSSLKNPAAIKFKDINGNDVSYDGSAAKDLTSGTYIAKLPYGFHSFTSGPTWGNTEGTSIACWNDSSGGSIDFRKDNPSSGKMSIKVDGRVYVNDGKNPVLSSEYGSGFWGMRTPNGGNDWIRTSNNGLIPYIEGTAGKGHSSLGTNNWYFSTAYIDKVYGSLKGRADTATTADTALSANKLTTARNIALGTDLRGSANFDGSGNITINATINSCQVSVGAKDTLPFKRIAHFETTSSYNDNALLLYISEGYINGRTGICRIEFRTDNIATDSTSITASAAVRWLVRNGFGLDSLYAGYYVTANKAYIDVYLKTAGGYTGTVIRVLQDSRGSINSAVQLISAKYNNDTDHKEAYSSVEAASTSLYGRDYTKIVSGVDAGTVGYANSTGSASSATKLQTARNLWGNPFDGTKDINDSIQNLPLEGGIYWDPHAESTTDASDAASITVVKAGVAGGTTLVLSQQNDANDTIQFKTNKEARLYHNSDFILTSKDTKVTSGKGYINNTEITQVNNANKWTTARAFTVGKTSKNVDGSSNVSWSLADIGAASSNHNHDNKYMKWFGNAGLSNMNAIGRISHSSGMTSLTDPGNNTDNPMEGGTKSNSWHLYWQTNYSDDPSSSNAWVAQIVNKAGTDRWWVRSRSGGTITDGTGWTSNWRFLVTAPTSGLGNSNQPIYINSAGEVIAANSYPTSLKNPYTLTLKANGTTLVTYDGSSAKEANFTYANIGAAPSVHTHAWNSLTHNSTVANQAILTTGTANGWKLETLNIANWNTAYKFVNSISGSDTNKIIDRWDEIKNFLAGITGDDTLNTLLSSKLSVYELADKTDVSTLKNNGIYYSTSDASSATLPNSPFNNGFALINITSYDGGDDLRRSRLAFNGLGEMKVSNDRGEANTAETWYNVLTSNNSGINGSTITLNGTSITVYSSGTADGRYVKKSGDTMTGALNFANNIWNKVGDDVAIGDHNIGGCLGIKGLNGSPGLAFYNSSDTLLSKLVGTTNQFQRISGDKVYNILDTSTTNVTDGKGVINGTTITQVDSATNADKLDGYHANGLLTALSNSNRGISLTVGGTTKSLSNISVGDANTVDGEHASAFTRIIGRNSINTNGTAPYKYIHLFRMANSMQNNTTDCEIDLRTRYHSAKLEIRITTADPPYGTGHSSISIIKKVINGRSCNFWVLKTVQSSGYNYYDIYYESGAWNFGAYDIISRGGGGTLVFEHKGTKLDTLPSNTSVVNNQWVVWNDIAGKPSSFTPAAHTHDGRYLRLDGSDTMQGNLNLCSYGSSYIGRGSGDKSGEDFTEANIVIRSWYGISFKSYDDKVRTYIDTRTGNIGTKGKFIGNLTGNAASATKVIVNQHTANDVNYPLVWSNQSNTSSVTENQLFKSWQDLYYNPKNKKLFVGGSVSTVYVSASKTISSKGFIHTSVTENASQYVLTADGGYTFLNQASNELAHEFSRDITVTSEWTDIAGFYGGSQSFLTQPGTYVVQVYYESNPADGMYQGYFSGIMSWYTGKTNSNNSDEIVLHRVGHAYSNTIYLRTRESLSSETQPYTKLQISANSDLKQHTYKFKFKRIC